MLSFLGPNAVAIFAQYDLTSFRFWFGDSTKEAILLSIVYCALVYALYRLAHPAFLVLRGMWNFWRLRNHQTITLEITPPAKSEKSPLATEHLFTVLREVLSKREIMALEVVAEYQKEIRYQLQVSEWDLENVKRHLASYMPEMHFTERSNPYPKDVSSEDTYRRIHEIKQSRGYAFPLRQHEDLSLSDPIGYIAGSMTKLEKGDAIVMQMVLAQHNSRWASWLYNKILNNGHVVLDHYARYFLLSRIWVWVVSGAIAFFTNDLGVGAGIAIILVVISLFIKGDEPSLTAGEQQLFGSVMNKLGQPLFRADIRMLVASRSEASCMQLSNGVLDSLAPYHVPGFQHLRAEHYIPDLMGQKIGMYKFMRRLPALAIIDSNVFGAAELASIYHFPYGLIRTEGMAKSHSRTLPTPMRLRIQDDFDVVVGQNNHHGHARTIGLTAAERERHMFVVGGTGSGKTTLLQYMIAQDIQNGKGVAVIDPHGDMAETLLQHIPEDRIGDVIYFNPDDISHPIGLNLLELPEGISGDDLEREKDLVTESIVSIFRKIFSDDDTGGHRIEYVLRNTVHTALSTESPTLFTLYDLLNDQTYRKKVIAKLENKDLQNFWKNELGKAGNFQQVKMMAGITAKIGRFLFSASARRILEQPRSTIDFDEILDGKILICNVSKGLLGEDTSELFGIALLAKIQLAALRRARQKQENRRPFYLYVDEFQNFATESFVQMLSEARKFKLFLTMAEQSTAQQDDRNTINIILGNVGTVVCFRTASPIDEDIMRRIFKDYIDKGEIASLPAYNFYMKIDGLKSEEPFSGETIVLGDGDETMAELTKKMSRASYAKTYYGKTDIGDTNLKKIDKGVSAGEVSKTLPVS